jgi:hypothetical protein
MTDLKIGDRVVVDVPPGRHFAGTIVGEGRQKLWWNVLKDGTKHLQGFSKSFCRPEPIVAVGSPPRPPQCDYVTLETRSMSEPIPADFQQVLDFLDSIEGAGYGGMSEFEIARQTMRNYLAGASATPTQIKAEYLRGECDSIHAIEMLQSHCGMSSREAEIEVYSWED